MNSQSSRTTLRIAVDARSLNRSHLRGIGKYLLNVLSATTDLSVEWRLLATDVSAPFHRPAGGNWEVTFVATRGHRFRLWEQGTLPYRAWRSGAQLLFCPSNTLPVIQPLPTVVAIHDMMAWQPGEVSDFPGWYRQGLLPTALRLCAGVITDSQSSQRDIVARWPFLANKLLVIPLGVASSFSDAPAGELSNQLMTSGICPPYFLYVGGSIPRKRLAWALEVFARLHHPTVQLVVLGVAATEHRNFIDKMPTSVRNRVIMTSFVAEEDLPSLYMNAVAVLYPTLYEGFGLPVVEAQAVGTPVLLSRVGSLTELSGPTVEFLPVENLDAWVTCCRRYLTVRSPDTHPNGDSRAWAKAFSWKECQTQLVGFFRRVVTSRSRLRSPVAEASFVSEADS